MSLTHVALLSVTNRVRFSELATVAAALSKQVLRDFVPLWNVQATVTAFPDANSIPAGFWKMTVQDDINEPGAAGYHTDDSHQPYALIQYDPGWTVTASHELLEMLGDPWGNRLHSGVIRGKRVQILEELCDPCESFTYTVGGISVSDFLNPHWYDTAARSGKRYSFLGKLGRPLEVADGGYVSFFDPADRHWYQMTNFGNIQIHDLGPSAELLAGHRSIREAIDARSAVLHPKLGKLKLQLESFAGPF